MGESIKTYKGFNKDMTCRGFQYEEGKEYEEESVEVCDHGFISPIIEPSFKYIPKF